MLKNILVSHFLFSFVIGKIWNVWNKISLTAR